MPRRQVCEDEENIVSITEDDGVHLLDDDDVETARTVLTKGNGMDVEDDVWAAAVARLGLENDQPIWGLVQMKPIVEDVWANVIGRMTLVDEPPVWGYVEPKSIYLAYEPTAHM
ncbi:hypothetical protein V6N13_124323 [Hibiscus sabdariffa]|uniref:Uncharacterized protein n=1 Tax=Hibiscus sabdariffa TaxID=183260 RepID=A0ABR2S1A2_9ROSI